MDLNNKICLVTGANSGLGFATAKQFAAAGANVVLVCRDPLKGNAAMANIKNEIPNAKMELFICDLASIKSIKDFVKQFKEKYSSLHVLFNNAAVMKSKLTTTEDGFETMFQTNYLAPVILTEALIDLLKSSSPAQIINIAVPQDKLRINFDDLQSTKHFESFDAFMKSKLYLLLYTIEFSSRLAGKGILINSIDPGMFRSGLSREFPWILRKMMGLFAKTADKAAEEIVYRVSANENRMNPFKIFVGKEEKLPTQYWNDSDVRSHLWSITKSIIE